VVVVKFSANHDDIDIRVCEFPCGYSCADYFINGGVGGDVERRTVRRARQEQTDEQVKIYSDSSFMEEA
jgi:hypothetical protein